MIFKEKIIPTYNKYLFSIVCDRLHDRAKGFDGHNHIQQMCSKEEVVEVTKHREQEVPHDVQEWLQNQKTW